MKRGIGFALTLALVMSLCACKQKPTDDSVLPDASPAQQGEGTAEQNQSTVSQNEITAAQGEDTPTQSKAELPSSQDTVQDKNQSSDTTEESSKELQVEDADNAKSSVNKEKFLPILMGYVDIKEQDGKVKYYAKKDKFTVKFDITEQIYKEAMENRTPLYDYSYKEDIKYTLKDKENKLPEGAVIVRGHFEENYGTSILNYEKYSDSTGESDFFLKYSHTLYDFTVDKIYTDSKVCKPGDTIKIAKAGGVTQTKDGIYHAGSGIADYTSYVGQPIENRTFVLSFSYSKEVGCNCVAILFQNAYEQVKDNTGDCKQQLAYDILQKYN